jgi:hypothetical protein
VGHARQEMHLLFSLRAELKPKKSRIQTNVRLLYPLPASPPSRPSSSVTPCSGPASCSIPVVIFLQKNGAHTPSSFKIWARAAGDFVEVSDADMARGARGVAASELEEQSERGIAQQHGPHIVEQCAECIWK